MTVDNQHKGVDFSDSICTCKEWNQKMGRDCFILHCKCCKKEDHSMVMNGFKGFWSS